MKMTKLLASGVAASLAVSSLAAVASATDRSFPMGKTQGTIKFKFQDGSTVDLGDQFYLTDEEFTKRTKTLGISEQHTIADIDVPDAKIAFGIDNREITNEIEINGVKKTYKFKADVSNLKLKLVVTGVKGTRGGATGGREYEYPLRKGNAAKGENADLYYLDVYATNAPGDGFLPEQFLEITRIQLKSEGGSVSVTTTDKAEYDWWFNSDSKGNPWGMKVNTGVYAATSASENVDTALLQTIQSKLTWGYWLTNDEKTTEVVYPFLAKTDANSDQKLGREEIKVLSDTNAYTSTGATAGGDNSNQSYINDDVYNGETKHDFDGLAGQVASFFNKQTNGTITFKFTTPAAAATGDAWVSGGVPSTQVGFKYLSEVNASPNDFALFLNYKQTGDLQAITSLDTSAGTVTFDISDILEALGGQTNGVVDNIYYGLTKGITYTNVGTGLYVEEITLAYGEDEDADDEIEDDTNDDDDEDDEDDTSADDDEDDADDEDDEDDYSADDDEDDDDEDDDDEDETPSVSVDKEDNNTNNNGDVAGTDNVVTPADTNDGNPDTGVALAVVPAIVAAAAVVVSKKRK